MHCGDRCLNLVLLRIESSTPLLLCRASSSILSGMLCTLECCTLLRRQIGLTDRTLNQPEEPIQTITHRARIRFRDPRFRPVRRHSLKDLLHRPAPFDQPVPLDRLAHMSDVPTSRPDHFDTVTGHGHNRPLWLLTFCPQQPGESVHEVTGEPCHLRSVATLGTARFHTFIKSRAGRSPDLPSAQSALW
ncbi:hypothetical protein [Microbacterium sp.]|uniref:hypothetical protein n=1 Tax=Microbacterium sp. TaxID=51671 RepID=UPI003A8CA3E3